MKHRKAAKCILRYLKGTKKYGIYKANSSKIQMYCDADFANDDNTRKSTSGYISILANGPVSWSQQKCVARSTTEAEYTSASDAAQKIVWLRFLIKVLLKQTLLPTELFIPR